MPMLPLSSTNPAARTSTAMVDFHEATGAERPAVLVFDLTGLPKGLVLSFYLPAGVIATGLVNITARARRASDPRPPAGFDAQVYDVKPSSRGELQVILPAYGVVRAYMMVTRKGPLAPGAHYAFHVQQYGDWIGPLTHRTATPQRRLIGGSTFVVPIEGTPTPVVARPAPPPEHHEDLRVVGWAPPWAEGDAGRRHDELITRQPTGLRVTAITVDNDHARYKGPCPVTITFRAKISVEGGPGVISYVWDRSDGALGPVEQLTVTSAGTFKVSTTWTLGGPGMTYRGSQRIRILGFGAMTSAPSEFSIRCTS